MIWEKRRLGDIADSCLGKMLDNEKNKGEYQPYLANVNVRWGSFDLENLHQMRFLKAENERYSLEYGDLVICEGGEPGRCAIWKNQLPNMKFQKALHRVRVHEGVDYRFLYYWFLNAGKHGILDQYSTGATIKHIPGDKLQRIMIDLPPQKAQKVIAEMLSVYDETVENNQKRIALLEQMAENLYKEWFVRFRFPGHETTEFENGIPKGWEFCTVESLSAVLQRGISPDYDDEGLLTVISQKCIRQNIMDIRESRRQTKGFKSDLNLKDGDTVICSTGTGTLGRVGQVYGEYPNTTFDSHVTLVRARESIGKHFLYWTLKEMQPWFMNMGIGSTNQQELYRGTIKNAKALCPDNKLVAQFESIIETIHRNIILLIKSQESLIKQRDLLLPRLMSGKLEVL